MALAASATAFELREVSLKAKPAELLAASPKGTVPVLVLPSGEVIDESLDIMLWALERHDPLRWLRNGVDIQDMQALIAECDGPFKRQLDAYKYPKMRQSATESATDIATGTATLPATEPGATADSKTSARQQASVFIDSLNQRLMHSACLCGAEPSLADMAIVPFVRQFAGVEPAWFAQMPWPALRGWLHGLTSSALFTGIMQRSKLSDL